MKNQNLVDLLSKVSLITTSIEDHVNRRFNRILVNNNSMFAVTAVGTAAAAAAASNAASGGSCSISPKNSNSSSAESGLTGSSDIVNINDVDSNDDDLSDDGLDYSQKFADNQHSNQSNEPSDEAFIGLYTLVFYFLKFKFSNFNNCLIF